MTSYVGNTPADKTLKLEKQQFTTSATTSYTLSHSVSDPQDIALFINNVRQNPNSSYTVSGTALTLSEATASTDTMYCVFLGKAIGTVGIGAGDVTKDKLDLISDSTAGLTVKGDGGSNDGYLQLNCRVNSHGIKLKSPPHSAGATYTLTFPNSVTADKFLKTDGSGNLSFADAGGNTPSFVAHADVNQSLSNASVTKLTVTSEDFDTDSAFADSKFTVPSGKAGKYFFVGKARLSNVTGYVMLEFYKNGSNAGIQFRSQSYGTSYESAIVTAILDLSASDYIELYGMQVTGGTANLTGKLFQGFKLG